MVQIIQTLYNVMFSHFISRNYALEKLIMSKTRKIHDTDSLRFSPKPKRNAINLIMWKVPRKICQGMQVEIYEGRRCTRKEGIEMQESHTKWHQWEHSSHEDHLSVHSRAPAP